MQTDRVVVVDGVRTPLGRADTGALIHTPIDELASLLIGRILERHRELNKEAIDDLYLGCAYPEGAQGLNIARRVAIIADLPMEENCTTVTRLDAASMAAFHAAVQAIAVGQADWVLVVGAEQPTRVRPGRQPPSRELLNPRLGRRLAVVPAAQAAQNVAEDLSLTRQALDGFAYASHRRAAVATRSGFFAEEVVPVEVPATENRDGHLVASPEKREVFMVDEAMRPDLTPDLLAGMPVLPDAVSMDGHPPVITRGNTGPLADGAACLLLAAEPAALNAGVHPLARVRALGAGGIHPRVAGLGAIGAIDLALRRAQREPAEVDLWEIGEEYATTPLAVAHRLGLSHDRINVNGGAIALGYPVGASGARMLVTLLHALVRRGATCGVAAQGAEGGQGVATVLERF